MFPNFTSLAQREQKRQELLERAQRRVRQSNTKRQMFAEASWASDITNGITTVPRKATEATQTDMSVGSDDTIPNEVKQTMATMIDQVIAKSDLKKSLRDEFSQTNPEVSTPSVADAGVQANPSTEDAAVEAHPQMSDAAVSVKPSVVDGSMNTKFVDHEEQVESRKWIKKLFEENENWVALRINPISRKDGKDNTKFFLGKNGSVINIRTGRKNRNYQSFDWSATEDKIRTIFYDAESNSIDEISDMRLEDPLYHASLINKRLDRKRKITSENNDSKRSKQTLFNSSTSTSSDQSDTKYKLLWILLNNRELLESARLNKALEPVLKSNDHKLSPHVDEDSYVWIDGTSISVFGKDSNRVKPAIAKKVDWLSTFEAFVKLVKERDVDVSIFTKADPEITVKEFVPGEGESRHGVLSGIDEDMDKSLTTADNHAKEILSSYYTKLQEDDVKIPFRLKPIVDTKDGVKPHSSYYFGQPTTTRPFNMRNDKNKPVSGDGLKYLIKTIRWVDTLTTLLDGFEEFDKYLNEEPDPMLRKNLDNNLNIMNKVLLAITKSTGATSRIKTSKSDDQYEDDSLKELHDESEAAFKRYVKAQDTYEIAKQHVKGSSSKAARSALKAASSAVKATKAEFNIKKKQYNDAAFTDVDDFSDRQTKLKGRGLRGAGVAPLEGVVRRGRTYNLNEIQGLATPSAYVYRQLGSKYIRIPDLDNKTLVIVQPNRRKCGPKRDISDSLQSMIRTLVYKNQIDQAEYDKLNIDDRKLFKEILAISHLQYNFHDRLEDPLESLRAEYDKLKGELELGNDNPSIIKQLKSLSVDMYSNRLISDNEFKEIITRLL